VLTDDIRAAAARVTARARSVRIVDAAIEPYAATLPSAPAAPAPPATGDDDELERRAAGSLQLNAINFGSGWFPTLRKPPGRSGFRTVEAGLRAHGPWGAEALTRLDRDELAAALGQDPEHELIGRFVGHLRDLGEQARDEHGGAFLALARCGEGSAEALATQLGTRDSWRDVSPYGHGDRVPFFKRAQIAAADLALAGIAPARDLHRLTLFADNLVPHVLRLDGVLAFAPELVERIEGGQLLEHGSAEEVEIRAVALHAVELLVAAHGRTTAAAVDGALWNRGGEPRYKARPRHRARCEAY